MAPASNSMDKHDGEQRYDHFQIMRGVACSMVFLNHVAGLLSGSLHLAGTWYEPLVVPVGFPWVWLFLILSGFLLTKQFVEGRAELNVSGILGFYGRRCRRLLPMLWFASVLFAVLYYSHIWSPDLPAFAPLNEIGVALALPWVPYLNSGNPVASVNSPVWSAVLEVHYFLLLPLVLWGARLSSRAVLVCVGVWFIGTAILATRVALHQSPIIFPMIYQQHLYNGGFMLAGCLIALLKCKPFKISWLWPVIAVAVLVVGGQYLAAYDLNFALAVLPMAMLPGFAFLVIQGNSDFQSRVPTLTRELGLSRGPLRWIELAGMMSYSVYLLHKPLSYIAINLMGSERWVDGLPSLAATILVTAVAIAPIIILSFIFVELRFRLGYQTLRLTKAPSSFGRGDSVSKSVATTPPKPF
jgi:peptidoglycan/LPS O-acetylase OafA/YrhL